MARYVLLEKAVIGSVVYSAGVEIGDGTQVPFSDEPGPHMEPRDDDARAKIEKAMKDAKGQGRRWDLNVMNHLPIGTVNTAKL